MDKEIKDLLTHIAEQLRLHRAKRNIGIRGMAKEIGVSSATLSRIENQAVMSLENYIKVTNWLSENGYYGKLSGSKVKE